MEMLKVVTENLTNSFEGSGAVVDAENSVIRGVKLIGFESKNGRSYPAKTLRAAVQHYEGVSVNVDHPRKPSDSLRPGPNWSDPIRSIHGKPRSFWRFSLQPEALQR